MTPFVCSVHTHSTFCDGAHSMAEMAAAAYGAGVQYYGFSGHAHTPCPSDVGVCMKADLTDYREEARRLQQEYKGRMEILLGIEWDVCSDVERSGFDYWIGSVHNLRGLERGDYVCVDWNVEHLTDGCKRLFGGDFLSMAEAYYREVWHIATMKPTILGHIDLITKLNAGNRLFDEEAPRYQRAALDALHAVEPESTLLEVNTGAMARGYRNAPYPAMFLLRAWQKMGGRVILTADAHSTQHITYGYQQAIELVKAAGFDSTTLLTATGWKACPI